MDNYNLKYSIFATDIFTELLNAESIFIFRLYSNPFYEYFLQKG